MEEVSSRRRRTLADSIQVDVEVAAADAAAAENVASELTADKLNDELMSEGLPALTIVKAAGVQGAASWVALRVDFSGGDGFSFGRVDRGIGRA